MDGIGVLSTLYQGKPVTPNVDVACFKECFLERQERRRVKVARAPARLKTLFVVRWNVGIRDQLIQEEKSRLCSEKRRAIPVSKNFYA